MLDEIRHYCIRVFPEPGMSAPRMTRAWVPAELLCLASTWKKKNGDDGVRMCRLFVLVLAAPQHPSVHVLFCRLSLEGVAVLI